MSLLERWRQWACADADGRDIPGLAPLLNGLAASLARLRSVDWTNELLKQSSSSQTPPEGGRK